jgi:hypothetical protein
LNVIGAIQPTAGITVDHTSVYSLQTPCNSPAELFEEPHNQHSVVAILDKQHLANTVILKNLLIQKMLDAIGLK